MPLAVVSRTFSARSGAGGAAARMQPSPGTLRRAPALPAATRPPRAVGRGWRSGTDAAVAGHVAACARCADVQAAAELLRAEHLRIAQAARVPPSAAMWWRVERRLREEHARRMQRIAFAVQAVALAA